MHGDAAEGEGDEPGRHRPRGDAGGEEDRPERIGELVPGGHPRVPRRAALRHAAAPLARPVGLRTRGSGTLPLRFVAARRRDGLEPRAALGNILRMETHRRPGSPFQDPPPPILDMTPEGDFRDPLPPPRGRLDRILGKVGGLALLLTLAAGGLLLVALAILFVGLLLPVAIGAGLVAFVSLWWRMRRLKRAGGAPGAGPDGVRFVVLRR